MTDSLKSGPLAEHVDLDLMREIHPEIVSFRSWLAQTGRKALDEVLRTPAHRGGADA